ncbi:MAG TPA: cytochrome c [Thermoanaerobaculia bacterium]|jgi:mono/diheme cytochrome c family protein|nr:cytochrome c [Thermoanaerobaculia bacterium]
MKTIRTLVFVLVLLALAGVAFVYSGQYDVAASTPDNGFLKSILDTTRNRSVARRADGITPPKLDDPQMIRTGLVHYHEMCTTCHGAPGVKISEIGQGLNPYPPELAAHVASDPPGETFWIVKNGLKMTGMPAFGVTHTDQEIWAIVAFLQKMPKLNPQEYQAMVQQAGLGAPGAEHEEHEHGEHHD